MSRINLLDATTAPISAARFFESGDPGPIVAALANVPELLAPTLGFVSAALGDGAASSRLKEFAILRTSALQGCQYCIHAHSTVAMDVGLALDEIRALRVALVTDYDAGVDGHEPVTMERVFAAMRTNVAGVQRLVTETISRSNSSVD